MKQVFTISLLLLTLCVAREGQCQGTWSTDSSNGFSPVGVAGSCVLGGKIYVIGGSYAPIFGEMMNTVQIFDPVAHLWIQGPNLSIGTIYPSCNALNGKIYAFGGGLADLESLTSTTVNVLDSATNTWSSYPPMPVALVGQESCILNGKIYIIGGYENSSVSPRSSVDIFDPSDSSWSVGPPMPTPRAYFGLSVLGGKIYVIGGWGYNGSGPLDSVVIFDSASNKWSIGPSLPGALSDCASSGLNGKIYVMGGFDESKTLDIFDTSSNTWSIGPNMSTGRSDLISSAVNGKVYAIGGLDNSGDAVAANEVFTPSSSGVTESAPTDSAISLRVFPNPAKNELQLLGGSAGTIHLFDLMGRERVNLLNDGTGATLDISKLEAGTYFVRIGNQSTKMEITR